MLAHDPETYWDHKARAHAEDDLAAVCVGNALVDRVIDLTQCALITEAWRAFPSLASGAGRRVLDHGCGTGRFVESLRARGYEYDGVDISGEMVRRASARHPGARFQRVRGALPMESESFDLVLSLAVVHHNPYEQQERMLDELARVLSPGGALILFEGLGARASGPSGLYHPRPAPDWLAALHARGLSCAWQRSTRYCPLATLAQRVAARFHAPSSSVEFGARTWSRVALRLDAWVGPRLYSARAHAWHDRLFAVLRKG